MNTILSVENLVIKYPLQNKLSFFKDNNYVNAVNDISFKINEGETLGLVGESGCGKTSTLRSIMQLLKPTSGKIYFLGKDLVNLSNKEIQIFRPKFQMIFQDSFSSMNPKMSVSTILQEPFVIHEKFQRRILII